jgi:hypothetical protein
MSEEHMLLMILVLSLQWLAAQVENRIIRSNTS